jgi:zinc protease
VGNIDVQQVIEQVGATFGALAPRAANQPRDADGVRFPPGVTMPITVFHHGSPEQGVVAAAWPTTDVFSDQKMSAVRAVLAEIMTARLFDSVRATSGASYTTRASGQASTTFRDYGYLLAFADIPPSKAGIFFDAVARITQELKSNPVSADELDRARTPAIAKLQQAQQTNEYWLGALSEVQAEPRFLELTRLSLERLKAVNTGDIQQAAASYFQDDRQWKLLVKMLQTP